MASYITRAERSGNIFFRVTGLIRSGQLSWSDRPLWYDVYAACPPLSPPDWNVKLPKHDEPVRQIFYSEDVVRAAFYKKFSKPGIISVFSSQDSASQLFIKEFEEVKKSSESENLSFDQLLARTEERMVEAGVKLQ